MNYDIAIAHRVSPALSKTSVGFTTKHDLVCATTRSLAEALERLDGRIRLIVILDGCPPEYEAVFRRFFPDSGAVHFLAVCFLLPVVFLLPAVPAPPFAFPADL